jgi:hypothetical protein
MQIVELPKRSVLIDLQICPCAKIIIATVDSPISVGLDSFLFVRKSGPRELANTSLFTVNCKQQHENNHLCKNVRQHCHDQKLYFRTHGSFSPLKECSSPFSLASSDLRGEAAIYF